MSGQCDIFVILNIYESPTMEHVITTAKTAKFIAYRAINKIYICKCMFGTWMSTVVSGGFPDTTLVYFHKKYHTVLHVGGNKLPPIFIRVFIKQ